MTCLARAVSGGLFGASGLSGSEGGGMSGPRPLASSWSRLARAIAPSPSPAPVRPKKWRRLMARTSSCSRFIGGSKGSGFDQGEHRFGLIPLESAPRQELIEVKDHVAHGGQCGQLGGIPAGGQRTEGV